MSLDPSVKFNLQQHLVNMHHRPNVCALKIGSTEKLEVATKIVKSQSVTRCFDCMGKPLQYPELPKRSYLVACVDRWLDVQVYAIYSLEQMREMEAQRGSGCVNSLDWKVLEISEEVETELMKDVDLEYGVILTSVEVAFGNT